MITFKPILFKKLSFYLGITFLAILCSSCSHLFYYPSDKVYYDPKKFNLKPQDVFFKTEDGETIHAWLFKTDRKKPLGTILFFHGNAENLTSHYIHLTWLIAEGYNYLIFDYPGYGQSTGEASQKGTVQAGIAAMDWLYKSDPQPLIIFAQSLGGAVAQRVILEKKDQIPIKGVVLDSTFNSYQSIARKKLSLSWFTWILQPLAYILVSDKWAAEDIDKISPIPVLVIHGDNDNTVEPIFGEHIYNELKEPKKIWRIPGGLHTDVFWSQQGKYRPQFLEWLAGLGD